MTPSFFRGDHRDQRFINPTSTKEGYWSGNSPLDESWTSFNHHSILGTQLNQRVSISVIRVSCSDRRF